MSKLLEILKSSSLRATMSDMEIEEIYEEIASDIERNDVDNDHSDEIESLNDEIADLESTITRLESEISKLKETTMPSKTLNDTLSSEWVIDNWEHMINLAHSGKDGMEILKMLSTDTRNHKRIILVGKAGSGKDHMRRKLESQGFKYAVSYTTRPRRDNETQGVDYHFLSDTEFLGIAERGGFYEHVSFNNWHYGTSNSQFFSDDVFIMTPSGISKLASEDRQRSFIIYLDVEESVRKERLSQRSDADTVERRLRADEEDFSAFTDYDMRIKNQDF